MIFSTVHRTRRLHLTAARAFRSVISAISCIFFALHLPPSAAVGEAHRYPGGTS